MNGYDFKKVYVCSDGRKYEAFFDEYNNVYSGYVHVISDVLDEDELDFLLTGKSEKLIDDVELIGWKANSDDYMCSDNIGFSIESDGRYLLARKDCKIPIFNPNYKRGVSEQLDKEKRKRDLNKFLNI